MLQTELLIVHTYIHTCLNVVTIYYLITITITLQDMVKLH